ncbi:MAG: riboflavin synthase [Hyphomicrobiales bacterium]
MFTGIITDQGRITLVLNRDQGKTFRIQTAYDPKSIDIGASIACNGVCLTVVALSDGSGDHWFEVEAWEEALRLTNAVHWDEGTIINLERSLKQGDELGGHMVSGHVDGIARVMDIKSEGDATRFILSAPDELVKFIVAKGSVALNGTSLTVNNIEKSIFDVLLIRHTLEVTTWGNLQTGDDINIEVDQMARYVVRLIEHQQEISK